MNKYNLICIVCGRTHKKNFEMDDETISLFGGAENVQYGRWKGYFNKGRCPYCHDEKEGLLVWRKAI